MGWGGVDKELDNQRKSLMTPLRELVSSGKGIDDVERVLSLDRSVRAKGSSLEEVAELNSNLMNLDMLPREIGLLLALSRQLLDQHLNPGSVKVWMSLDRELVEDGFNKTARMLMREACEKYGGVVKTLEVVNKLNALSEIRREHSRLKGEVERLSIDKEELDTRISQNTNMINAVNNAYFLGFNTVSLTIISESSKTLGGPYKVAEAIQKYSSIRKIDEELEAKKAELENAKKETSEKTLFINAINYTLKEAKETYERNSDVRQVVELLVNPRARAAYGG